MSREGRGEGEVMSNKKIKGRGGGRNWRMKEEEGKRGRK